MKKFKYDTKYLYWGITALAVIAIAIATNHLLSQWGHVAKVVKVIIGALRPVIIGLILAYVLNPLLKIYEKYIFSPLYRLIFKKNEKLRAKITRMSGIILSIVTAFAIVTGLIVLIVPELYVNIQRLVTSFPGYVENAIDYLTKLAENNPDVVNPVMEYLEDVSEELVRWGKNKLLPGANQFITSLSAGIYETFNTILDVVIGVIVTIYVLGSKEKYKNGAKKYIYALFNKKWAERVLYVVKYTDDRFGGFLAGKILDSVIIGVLSFLIFSIAGIPYALLVSVIVGVTNIIPFFGPFIGAIPSAILVLLVNPPKALVFVILILAIQQVDGNIIGPKILGDRTGLDSFAVIVAILVSAGLFGVAGMILGVPVFATVLGLLTEFLDRRLQEKNLPLDLEAYESDKPLEIEAVEKE
ncbi:MAG: AI-2E family transporter [Clostridia bacterium]